ncbi:MAG: hypothetical protein E7017_01740 [Alphaproteobacteria bacterium]|nr:hypothetical protein [Alphaproteobacteria bacterium]
MKGKTMNETKLALAGVTALGLIITACNLWGSNDYAEYKIRQAAGSGEMTIITEAGMYWDGFADISNYRVSGDIDFEEVTTMSDGAKVTFSGSVKFRLPSDEATRLKLHKDFGSYDNVVENLIKKNTIDVLSNKTAPMFTASDTYSARKPEIARVLEGQLQNGAYDVYYEEVKMQDGTKYRLAKVRTDESGKPKIIGKNLLSEYGIEIQQVVMGDPRPEEKILKIIDAQKEAEQKAVLARSQAEKARQDTITITEQGKAAVAQAEAEAKAKAIIETTEAAKNRDVSKLNAEKAEYDAKKILAEGKAQAEANRLKVSAGLTPQEKAEWDYKTKVGIAQAVASVKFPNSMVISGGSDSGSVNPFDAVGLKSLYDLSNKMSQ